MNKLIFSVEDDLNIQNVLIIALKNSNFDIEVFNDAKSLFQQLEQRKPDLFLLDIMLPDIDGLEIIKHIRNKLNMKEVPIMIISAKVSEIDKVVGLDLGADDYLVKPFGVLELVSRVKALLRRVDKGNKNSTIEISDLKIDAKSHTCHYKEKEMILTKKQFDLLYYLIQNSNKVVEREELLNNIWGYDFIGESRTLDVHIKDLRKKLKDIGIDYQVIETIRGIGYKFEL